MDGPLPLVRGKTLKDIEAERIANLRRTSGAVEKRSLQRNDAKTSKSPFMYDPNALGSLRPDQVPRFFGALTDSEDLPKRKVQLDTLHAMQDRVDPAKVDAMRAGKGGDKLPLVVQHQGRHYIADGHHRLAAKWLNSETDADVRFKNLDPVSSAVKSEGAEGFSTFFKVSGVNDELGLVFGWAIICKEDGADYYDVQKNHIPEEAMVHATTEFMKGERVHGEQHSRGITPQLAAGTIVHSFPLTTEIAKAMGIQTTKTGWMVASAPDKAMLAKFKSGDLTGFSIGGEHLEVDGRPVVA